ncbi:MAG: hypothetical protein ACSLE9_15090 [Burkholderiaceae bacterium]
MSSHHSDALHTVALTVPGSQTRVLVERLLGTPDDARELARVVVQELFNASVVRIAVVRSDDITDVPAFPLETN